LKQARGLGLSFILACQNLSDLKRDDCDLTDIVLGNTSVKVFTSAQDERVRDYLQKTGGDKVVQMFSKLSSTTESDKGTSTSEGETARDTKEPVFNSNTLNELNAHRYGILEAVPMSGYSRYKSPVVVEFAFSMSAEEFAWYTSLPWPDPNGISTVRASDLPPDPDDEAPAPAAPPEPPTPSQPSVRLVKRRRPPKEISPEERQVVDEIREHLRSVGGGNKPS